MSNLELIHWGCCGQTFEVQIWHSINRQLNPGKIEEFALGKINQIVCPKCCRSLQGPWPVLFHDMDKEIMVLAGDVLDEIVSEGSEELEDAFSETGRAMLKVEDPIVAARALVAFDTSELPAEIRAHNKSLSEREVNAEAFRILYQDMEKEVRTA